MGSEDRWAEALREALVAALHDAQAALRDEALSDEARVHEARKALRRGRAQLALLRPHVDRRSYKRWDVLLALPARLLSVQRDADVLAPFLAARAELWPEHRGVLLRARSALLRDAQSGSVDSAAVEAALARALATMEGSAVVPLAPGRLAEGFGASWDRLVRARSKVKPGGEDAAWHLWRKRVKLVRHQLQLLVAWGWAEGEPYAARLAEEAQQLGELTDELLAWRFVEKSAAKDKSLPALTRQWRTHVERLQRRLRRRTRGLYMESAASWTKRVRRWLRARGRDAEPVEGVPV